MKANPDGTKRCSKCGKTKPVSEFSRNRETSDGLHSRCRECHNAQQREYNQRPDVKARHRAAQKARIRKALQSTGFRRKNWAKDPRTRLNNSMRLMIFHSLGRGRLGWHWELLVGYTIDDLIAHLETHFNNGMSWENFGEWEVEHVVPREKFEYASAEDPSFRDCWALSNLRPRWR